MMYFRRVVSKQLGEILAERGIIAADQLKEALDVQKEEGGLLGEILVRLGFAKEEEITQALTTQFGFPYLPLDSYEIEPEIIKLIPENVARQYWLMPIDRIGNTLTVAMADPLNTHALEDIEFITKCKVQPFVTTISNIKEAIDNYYAKAK